jgi:hypothetical protein
MRSSLTPLQAAERIARRQEGALDHRQAAAAGLSAGQIHRAVASGRWWRPARGVYVVSGAPETPRQQAMVAFLASRRAGGVLSHESAAADRGLLPWPALPWTTVPPTSSARCVVAEVHRSVVPAIDRAHRSGLVLTSVSRTIVDLAGRGDRPMLEAVVDAAFCRKLATARSVLAAAERTPRGRAGRALARAVVEIWNPGIAPGSPAEVRLLRAAAVEGIHGLVPQFDVFDERGRFVARLDLAQPDRRRGFEYDGVETHNPRRWARDEPRYARLRALGWEIEPISKLDLLPGERRLRDIARRWAHAA